MRKSTALGFALCGTLLVILLFIAGRMLYIKFYHQSFTDIAGKGVQASLMLSENDTSLPAVTDEKQIASYTDLLGGYTYTPYPYLFGLIAIFIVGSGLYSVDYWLLYILAGH